MLSLALHEESVSPQSSSSTSSLFCWGSNEDCVCDYGLECMRHAPPTRQLNRRPAAASHSTTSDVHLQEQIRTIRRDPAPVSFRTWWRGDSVREIGRISSIRHDDGNGCHTAWGLYCFCCTYVWILLLAMARFMSNLSVYLHEERLYLFVMYGIWVLYLSGHGSETKM